MLWILTLVRVKIVFRSSLKIKNLKLISFPCSSPPPPAGGFGGGRAGERDMYFVYAIYNRKHNKIYIGQTESLEERLKLHNDKFFKKSYTSRFDGQWVLIYKEVMESRIEALRKEKQLKSFRGREFVKKHIPL